MLDYFDLMNNGANVQKFFATGTLAYQYWLKPKGAKMVFIFCLGAGAGGGGGFTRAAGNPGGGGGGGGSGGLSRITVAASMIPDELRIRVGTGGVGGAANTAGSQGEFTVISTMVSGGNKSLILASSVGNSVGGNPGTASAGGTGGIGSTIATTTQDCLFSCLGDFIAFAGQTGANGGAQTGANGNSVTWGSIILSSGAGGGGTTAGNFAGGNISVAAGIPISTITGGNPGESGTTIWQPFCSAGGAGGSSNNSGVGGAGGNGGLGSGGGGGGAGTTGGTGGRGGDGFVMIISI